MMLHIFFVSWLSHPCCSIFLATLVLQTHAGFISCIFLRTITVCFYSPHQFASTAEKNNLALFRAFMSCYSISLLVTQLSCSRQGNQICLCSLMQQTHATAPIMRLRKQEFGMRKRALIPGRNTHIRVFSTQRFSTPAFDHCELGPYINQICVDLIYI